MRNQQCTAKERCRPHSVNQGSKATAKVHSAINDLKYQPLEQILGVEQEQDYKGAFTLQIKIGLIEIVSLGLIDLSDRMDWASKWVSEYAEKRQILES